MPLVFVYGSLREGYPNWHVNTGTRVPGAFQTRDRLPLYLLGDGHVPCIVWSPGVGHNVRGEVYEVDAEGLARMDRLERLGDADGYRRVVAEVERVDATRGAVLSVLVYVKEPAQVDESSRRTEPLVEYTPAHAERFEWRGAD